MIFRFGRVRARASSRTHPAIPLVDRLRKVNVQIITMPVPTQEGITRDNVSSRWTPSSTSGCRLRYFRAQAPLKGHDRGAELPLRHRSGSADLTALDHWQE
ncbi:hypothetical protein [Acrocarpospora phusangensis]|uniref:hypothetical protein n=1 Tax=Acrocarpospora phusangensis TaxID=1070424 RepID=UPI0035A25046